MHYRASSVNKARLATLSFLFVTLILWFSFSATLYAHGGRTNKSGCHNNSKTGDYHCHNSIKKNTPGLTEQSKGAKGFSCVRKYCKDMSSCEEAMYQYKTCGIDSLDGDSEWRAL